jgi:hypothetical protein
MIQVCSNFDSTRVFVVNARPDEIAAAWRAQPPSHARPFEPHQKSIFEDFDNF